MIGIVLVSHVAAIANGAADLAKQMGGDVPIAPAGGIDGPDGDEVGTDATRVVAAIEDVWSEDGVVVLMDLGSAMLSADLALELLDEHKRQTVRLSDAPLVEGAVAAATAAQAGLSLDQVLAEARSSTVAKTAQLGPSPSPGADPDAGDEPGSPGADAEAVFLIRIPAGLHARPAAKLVSAMSPFDATCRVNNATLSSEWVPATSFTSLSTLGLLQGHEMGVRARGPDADAAIAAVRELVDDDFGETVADLPAAGSEGGSASGRKDRWGQDDAAAGGSVHPQGGVGASPGIAVGRATRLVPVPSDEGRPETDGDRPRTADELRAAIHRAAEQIGQVRSATARRIGESEAAIFDAHLAMLGDPELLDALDRRVRAGEEPVSAWTAEMEALVTRYEALDDPYQRARAADARSVAARVEAALLGAEVRFVPAVTPGILVADDLDPAQTADLDPAEVRAILTALGGPTSHAAIIARSLGIPAVVAAGSQIGAVGDGTMLIVNGDTGEVVIEPDADKISRAEASMAQRQNRLAEAALEAHRPAQTLDGIEIEVAANVATVDDAHRATRMGADGIGLLRTELLFLDRQHPPDVDEQRSTYREIIDVMRRERPERRIVIRTLDIGGDKPVAFLDLPRESNPFLGVRGVRLGLRRPHLLRSQLEAIASVAHDRPVAVMFPMVTTLADLEAARRMLDAAVDATGAPAENVEVGIMVEVPATSLMAAEFARHVDFFSIGTNDLTQYVMAAERGNSDLADLSDPLHPAVLRSIAAVTEAADETGPWVGVCGEAAGDLLAVPVLIGLGVTELSVAPSLVPQVKQVIRGLHREEARELAASACSADSSGTVRSLVQNWMEDGATAPTNDPEEEA